MIEKICAFIHGDVGGGAFLIWTILNIKKGETWSKDVNPNYVKKLYDQQWDMLGYRLKREEYPIRFWVHISFQLAATGFMIWFGYYFITK